MIDRPPKRPNGAGSVGSDGTRRKQAGEVGKVHQLRKRGFFQGIDRDTGQTLGKLAPLGGIVFSDKEKLRQLNGIIYPYIIYRIITRIDELSRAGEKHILLDAPTLFEANADDLCDLIISVTADENIRLRRIVSRDDISPEAAKKRFESQYSEHFFISHSDFVIKNNKTPDILTAKAEEVAGRIKEYYNAKANG